MAEMIRKSFRAPDEVLEFPDGKYDVIELDGLGVGRLVAEPGWPYSTSLGSNCPTHHGAWLMISGRLAVEMEDGTVEEFGPGDIGIIPPGHDAWVVGDEPAVGIDFQPGGIDTSAA